MLSALLLPLLLKQAGSIEIYRGASFVSPHYWDVRDTYLDSTEPDKSFGGSYTLLGGKGKTILICFGDLNRVIRGHKRITKATLFLSSASGDAPVLHSAGRLLRSWGEGPRTVLSKLYAPPPKPGVKPVEAHWEANFRQRKAGIAGWQTGGAMGAEDQAPIPSAHLDVVDGGVVIGGLDAAVQKMLDHPDKNYGFALNFDSNSEFSSSKAITGRPRLTIESEDVPEPAATPDLSVISITSDPSEPREGQDVTYTATIKNVGGAPSQGFSGRWEVDEKVGQTFEKKETLAPGAVETVTLQKRCELSPSDHRLNPIEVDIEPVGADGRLTNNSLSITEGAVPVSVSIPADLAAKFQVMNYLGSKSWEDWAQSQVELWNDTVAAQSRFSFAPEGALERIRINSFTASGDRSASIPEEAEPTSANIEFLKRLGLAVGLLNGSVFEIPSSKVEVDGSKTRTDVDLYPGLMGYGDTRFDGGVPGPIPLPYVPVYDSALVGSFLEPTDLLSANDVAGLNAHLSSKAAKPSDNLLPISKAIILRAVDYQGTALANTDLLFFQSSGGGVPGGNPLFAVKTHDSGIAILNGRGSAGPFGDLSPTADNGVFLVQAKLNGVLETGWLSAWELNESNIRGSITFNLYLNLPGSPLDLSTNYALDRTLTDSLDDLPAKLAPLIDDDDSTSFDFPDAKGSWVQLDLGRDRTIDEIDLVSQGKPFWQQFDITAYGTGQQPAEGHLFARELNWAWTSLVRRDPAKSSGAYQVAYRGFPDRIRYIRIVNKSGGAGALSELRVFAANLAN
jgi:hypothetical protein